MEASAIHARTGLGRGRVTLPTPLLRLRSDQQLVGLFRGGNDDAFRVIHDRYRARLVAYVRQMLPGAHPDAEDVLQDVFVRAHSGLRANGRELALRPWLYRIAHNRCVDELRRATAPAPESLELAPAASSDPVLESERRESLRRLIVDIRRLPDQQRSALLMREMSGMAYSEIADALGFSVPAVKSLLVRARVGLAAAVEARDTACHQIRGELAEAHDRGVRPSGLARRHLRDCSGCQAYRAELRSVSRQLAALAPVVGPLGVLARLIGAGSGGGAAAGGTGSGVLAAGGAASAGTTVLGAAATHVAAVVAAAVVTAGGALEIQRTVAAQLDPPPAHHHAKPLDSVGHGTSVGGTVAAAVAAPLSSAAPAPVQQAESSAAPVPSGPAAPNHRRRAAKKHKRVASTSRAAAPSQTTPNTSAASTPTATDPTAAAATNAPTCQVPPTTVQTLAAPSSDTAACPPSTATDTSGAPSSTAPDTSAGSSPSSGGTLGNVGSSTPASPSSPSTATTGTQAQKS